MESASLYTHTFSPWRVAKDGARIVASERTWKLPLRWDRAAKATASRSRVWVGPDVFEDWAGPMVDSTGDDIRRCDACGRTATRPVLMTAASAGRTLDDCPMCGSPTRALSMDDVRRWLFDNIDQTPHLDYLLCTERPAHVLRMTCNHWATGKPGGATLGRLPLWPKHVWLGTTAANQSEADDRIPHLLRVPAAIRFVRITGRVAIEDWLRKHGCANRCHHSNNLSDLCGSGGIAEYPAIGWVIVSGGSEPLHPDWVRSVRDQCQAAGVPFYFEGWGRWKPFDDQDPAQRPPAGAPVMHCDPVGENGQHWYDGWASSSYGFQHVARVGKAAAGRVLDGRTWDEIPAVS